MKGNDISEITSEGVVETDGDCFQTSQTVLCIAYLKLMHIVLGVCAHFGAEQEQN